MAKFTTTPVRHNGKRIAADQPIDVSGQAAQALLDAGAIRDDAAPVAPSRKKGPKNKGGAKADTTAPAADDNSQGG